MPCTDPARGAAAGTLYLIRHGRTAGNGRHYVGWEDLDLDPTGRAQAAQLARALAGVTLHAIYCSTLARARQTAMALLDDRGAPAAPALKLQARTELMEINYGELQGKSKAEHALHVRRDFLTRRMPGGESLTDVHARVARFALEAAARLRRDETLAVVAHYRSLQLLRGVIVGETLEQTLARSSYRPANGSVLRLDFGAPTEGAPLAPAAETYTADLGTAGG